MTDSTKIPITQFVEDIVEDNCPGPAVGCVGMATQLATTAPEESYIYRYPTSIPRE